MGIIWKWPSYTIYDIAAVLQQISVQQQKEISLGILDPAKISKDDEHPIIELTPETEQILVDDINEMVNMGEIIQIKDRFRMPYSDNKNTISCCSNIVNSKQRKDKNRHLPNNSENEDSNEGSHTSNENGDVYVSCKAKYNNKNNTLMICKKASSHHNQNNYVKRY